MPNRKSKFWTPRVEAARLRTDEMRSTWASALQVVEAAEDDAALGLAAALQVECCISFHDDLIIDQVEFDAAHSKKLRRALTGTWVGDSMSLDVIARLRAIQKSVPDPLPEMLSDAQVEQLLERIKTEGAV